MPVLAMAAWARADGVSCLPGEVAPGPSAWADSGAEVLSWRLARHLELILPRSRVQDLIHLERMTIIRLDDGSVLSHRLLDPEEVAAMTGDHDPPGQALLGLGTEGTAALVSGWTGCPDRFYRWQVGAAQLFSRPDRNRAGMQVVVIQLGGRVHYLDGNVAPEDWRSWLGAFRSVAMDR